MNQPPLFESNGQDHPIYEVVFDGGSLGNPGKGYGSFYITGPEGFVAHERREFGNAVTNNQAEYLTLIAALQYLHDQLGPAASQAHLIIRGDSQLIINQVTGLWKVRKPELLPLRQQAVRLLEKFGTVEIGWHGRAETVKLLGH